MEKNYFYLQSQLKFRDGENAKFESDVFKSAHNIVAIISHKLFTALFSKAEITSHIEELQTFASTNKFHLSGFVTIGCYVGNNIEYYNLKVTNKNIIESPTYVKILTKKTPDTDKKKPITVDEKVELVRKFFNIHGRLPNPDEELEGCKIGKFVEKLENDNQIFELIRSLERR